MATGPWMARRLLWSVGSMKTSHTVRLRSQQQATDYHPSIAVSVGPVLLLSRVAVNQPNASAFVKRVAEYRDVD
ncbi:hypothetical protein GCM10023176_57480 [Micromonospora coerulea]|uniref:Uncharacterized protein n=1 Tax=Micromonospora coerulea TaxID=47856 RepID=A0ABP8T3C1_9ACTN